MTLSKRMQLIIRRTSMIAIPADGGLADGVRFLKDPTAMSNAIKEATVWVDAAINAIQEAPGGEDMGDDETVAGLLLDEIEQIKATRK